MSFAEMGIFKNMLLWNFSLMAKIPTIYQYSHA